MKYINFNHIKEKRGISLFLALFILAGVLVVSLTAASILVSGLRQSRTQAYSTKAYFAAEAGAERALWELRKNSMDLSDASCQSETSYIDFSTSPATCVSSEITYNLLNNATYSLIFSLEDTEYVLNSIGKYKDTKRSVKVAY